MEFQKTSRTRANYAADVIIGVHFLKKGDFTVFEQFVARYQNGTYFQVRIQSLAHLVQES